MMRIRDSVGRGGRNNHSDVAVVQTLLNRHTSPPAKLLVIDGLAGPKTIGAILALQYRLRMNRCDGRVDPAGRTFTALISSPQSIQLAPHVGFPLTHAFNKLAKTGRDLLDRTPRPKTETVSGNPTDTNHPPVLRPTNCDAIAWGAKVNFEFKKRVIEIAQELEVSPDYLMTCMAFETGESFRADQRNLAGGSAIGLIQFTKPAWKRVKTTRDELARMTAVEQLEFVRCYFLPYKGKLMTLEDVYMVILCPAAVGKGPDGVLYAEDDNRFPENYQANKGLDTSPKDGKITVRECSGVLRKLYLKGLSSGYFG